MQQINKRYPIYDWNNLTVKMLSNMIYNEKIYPNLKQYRKSAKWIE